MNDAHRNTIVTLLSEEIGKGYANELDYEGQARIFHLWDTLKAFQDMWDNLQMVKEASNE